MAHCDVRDIKRNFCAAGSLHIFVLPIVETVGLEVGSLYSFSVLLGIKSQTTGLSQVN